jgi:N-acyl-phosphatidylethanolamine-hydrolysing phospholipase D
LVGLPKTNILLLTHSHYDHLDTRTLSKFPHKDTNVVVPLKLDKFFKSRGFKNIKELDWYQSTRINDEVNITLLPAVHWSKRTPFNTNKTLWGSFLIEYKGKKILFACDTGIGNIYNEIGNKYGPIDIFFINIGAYNFKPMFDRSVYHTTPEEAVEIGKMVKAKKNNRHALGYFCFII